MTNLKMAHSIPYNLWAAKCWHIELNCTLLSNKLAAQPRHLGTVSAYAPGQVSIEGIGSWEVNLNQKKKKKEKIKRFQYLKGNALNWPSREKETVIRIWHAAVCWPERHIIPSSHLFYFSHPLSCLACCWWWYCHHEW